MGNNRNNNDEKYIEPRECVERGRKKCSVADVKYPTVDRKEHKRKGPTIRIA